MNKTKKKTRDKSSYRDIYDQTFTMRIDDESIIILEKLADELNFSKAEIVRKSLRLLKELTALKKKYGEISLGTEKDEKIIILLS